MYPEDCGHQCHVIIALDTAVIIDDISRDTDDPERHVHTLVFVVAPNEVDLPGVRDIFWALVRRLIFAP